MNTRLSIGFDSGDALIDVYFDIINPSTLPLEGEIFDCKWKDFIKNKKVVEFLEDYDQNGCWIVHVVSKYFSKKEVVCNISLCGEGDYKDLIKRLNRFK